MEIKAGDLVRFTKNPKAILPNIIPLHEKPIGIVVGVEKFLTSADDKMASIFTTVPGNTVKGFGGRLRPIPFYLQFVPGICIETVTSRDSLSSNGLDKNVNSILAIPHVYDGPKKKKSGLQEKDRYLPLMRGIVETPAKGDPVLLCSISGVNYYLGPLNTYNDVNWNKDTLDV